MEMLPLVRPVIVDHTYTITPDSPGYLPEDTIEMTPLGDGPLWHDFRVSLSEHFGTHLDAPSHFGGALTVDQIPAANLIGPVVVVDVREQVRKEDEYQLQVDDVLASEVAHGKVPAGAIVVMYTGWQERWSDPTAYRNLIDGAYRFPGFSESVATWLLEQRDIVGIGIDTLSIDAGPSVDYPVHKSLLRANRWALENLANLDRIPVRGGLMVVGPLKHKGGSGGPARVYTFLESPFR